jgi:hypothetical protein
MLALLANTLPPLDLDRQALRYADAGSDLGYVH